MKFIFLGDVHGNLNHCLNLSHKNPNHTIVQIGDLGVGFVPQDVFYRLPRNFTFFAGNHDNRQLCNKLPYCLGDYGDFRNRFFFVSGADSIDKDRRIEGVSWWPDEELTYQQSMLCLDEWSKSKTDTLVSHDCPQSFAEGHKLIYDKSLTRNLLQMMIEVRKPKRLIHGHHHRSHRATINGIEVIELGIDEPYEIEL